MSFGGAAVPANVANIGNIGTIANVANVGNIGNIANVGNIGNIGVAAIPAKYILIHSIFIDSILSVREHHLTFGQVAWFLATLVALHSTPVRE